MKLITGRSEATRGLAVLAAAGVLGASLDDVATTIANKIPRLTTGIGST